MRAFKSLSLVGEWEGFFSDVLGNRMNLAISICHFLWPKAHEWF